MNFYSKFVLLELDIGTFISNGYVTFLVHIYTISRDFNVSLFYSTYLKRDNAVFLLPTRIRYKRAEKLLK